jgi:polyhydroxyalkanoate synthesis regulator phasin
MSHLREVFSKHYENFASDLLGAVPEFFDQIHAALALSQEERLTRFVDQVLPNAGPTRDATSNPGAVLPGVVLTDSIWDELSEKSQKAIQEHLTVLAMCCLYDGAKGAFGEEGPSAAWSEAFLKDFREKLGSLDSDKMSKKLADLLKNLGPSAMPQIPERLKNGHLMRLVEQLVKEFKPEDFELSPEELAECDKDPTKAFTLLSDLYTKKPEVIQKVIKRIAKRLQDMVQKGELRPEQIRQEAEELMKEFTENNSFMGMLESFRDMFGMEDPDLAREVGRDGDARRNIVKERLRKKLDAKKAAKK